MRFHASPLSCWECSLAASREATANLTGKRTDLNKSEEIAENAPFHSPSSDAEKDKLPIFILPPFSQIRSTEKLAKFIHNAEVEMNKTAGSGVLPLSLICKNMSELNFLYFAI